MLVHAKAMSFCGKVTLLFEKPMLFCANVMLQYEKTILFCVKALPVSVAKKSINDALPVMSETEFIFIAGKQTCSIQATFGLFSCRARLQKILCGRGFPALAFVKF